MTEKVVPRSMPTAGCFCEGLGMQGAVVSSQLSVGGRLTYFSSGW
jgi:hypothetical protein